MNIYSIISILSAICTFFLGVVVFLRGPRLKINKMFLYFSFAVTIWLGATAFVLQACRVPAQAILWDKIVYLGVILIPPTSFHFSSLFIQKRRQKIAIGTGYVIALFFALALYGDIFVSNLIYYPWGCHTQAGYFHGIFLIYFALFIFLMFRNFLQDYKKLVGEEKVQRKYILVAFGILSTGALGFLPAYGVNMPPVSYVSGFLSVVILAYAVVKHHLLNVKVIATEIFSALIAVFVLVDALLSKTTTEFVLKFALFGGVAVFGILIIRSVLNEIKSKEKIAQISEDLRIANLELKRLDQSKSEFLSIASHQLRTPLTAIKGYSSMILEGEFGALTKKAREAVDKVFQSSQRLVAIVDDFLNISRIEAGTMKYEIVEFDLQKITETIVNDFAANNEKAKELKLKLFTQKADFTVKGDQNKIAQVVSNLVDNSLKYTLSGFVKVFLSEGVSGKTVLLKVQDTGVGISKDMMPRLFQKFSRAEDVSRLHTGGAGLGLYVAKRILEDQRGRIWAESEGEGKGSTFCVELPRG